MVKLGKTGSLAKASEISLDTLMLDLSATGEASIHQDIAVSGHDQQTVNTTIELAAGKTWKAKGWTRDLAGMIVHLDSTTFTVLENDTIDISLSLPARYSMISATFLPISDSAKSCELWLNGAMVADTVFGKNSGFSEVRLEYDYIPASLSPGTANTILLNIRGDWIATDTLLWSGQGVINVISGEDISQTINLAWVGPQVGGGDVSVVIGKVATITVSGQVQPRPNTSQ
jgi:hypothetical protein